MPNYYSPMQHTTPTTPPKAAGNPRNLTYRPRRPATSMVNSQAAGNVFQRPSWYPRPLVSPLYYRPVTQYPTTYNMNQNPSHVRQIRAQTLTDQRAALPQVPNTPNIWSQAFNTNREPKYGVPNIPNTWPVPYPNQTNPYGIPNIPNMWQSANTPKPTDFLVQNPKPTTLGKVMYPQGVITMPPEPDVYLQSRPDAAGPSAPPPTQPDTGAGGGGYGYGGYGYGYPYYSFGGGGGGGKYTQQQAPQAPQGVNLGYRGQSTPTAAPIQNPALPRWYHTLVTWSV